MKVPAGLAVLLAALFAIPLAAQDDPAPIWTGVFEGTIGRYPVVACFDRQYDGDGFGSYYYLSQLKPIQLVADDTKTAWMEGAVYGFKDNGLKPVWKTVLIGEDSIKGTWRSGARKLPISLTRMPDGAEDYSEACGAANFLAARIVKPEFTETPASLGNFDYVVLDYRSPAHFEYVTISSFTFAPSQPGDAKIVAQLESMLPRGSTQDEYIQCLAGVLAKRGEDGAFEQYVSPGFVNDQLLSFQSTSGTDCGGAHSNYWQEYFTFDRQSGERLEPVRWFNEAGIVEGQYGGYEMQDPLKNAVLQKWPADAEPECLSAVRGQQYWNYQLLSGGISFQPDLPHVLAPCEEQMFLSWEELTPFLSEEGQMTKRRAQQ